MVVSIEIPDELAFVLKDRASRLHSSMQAEAIKALELGLGGQRGQRVRLPLIPSREPGTLRSLTNAEIDGILGQH